LKKNSGTLSVCTWIRPKKRWCSAATRRVSARRWKRTQRGLPLKKGYSRTQTHDYIRHGTITLFAALSYLEGKIISRTEESHTHLEWLRFLKQIDRETPKELDVHLIVDNYATHKHPVVRHWLSRHPRFYTHFTPTSSSWLNLVERFFAELTSEVVREGSFQSLRQLVRAIESYLVERNRNPKKYVWRASGLEILEKIKRARAALADESVIST
jgi:transposase